MIPIVIICYNNYKYVDHTINQIKRINTEYLQYITIVNNASSDAHTINYLKNTTIPVIWNKNNNGPWINGNNNADIYNMLPDKFILTDPDLGFNTNLPTNFIEHMIKLSNTYNCKLIGFALDISDFDKMYNNNYCNNCNIYDWEKQFWNNKINNNDYELYYAAIDTTFVLINKNVTNTISIRIGGNFTAKHLPWYKENIIFNVYENYILNKNTTHISTISKLIIPYVETHYLKIIKNKEFFLIENDVNDTNLNFWKNNFTDWKCDMFNIFDKYLSSDKIFIDIGGCIGASCIYGSRKSNHVYVIEADNEKFQYLAKICKINCNNITLIDTTDIKNITRNINLDQVSLINVDMKGGEEYLLNDLYDIHNKYNIPIYISFYYSLWHDTRLDRFIFLSDDQKNKIQSEPFISLLL